MLSVKCIFVFQRLSNPDWDTSLLLGRGGQAKLHRVRGQHKRCRIRRSVLNLPPVQNIQRPPHGHVLQVRFRRTVPSVSVAETLRIQDRVCVKWAAGRPADLPQPVSLRVLQAPRLPALQVSEQEPAWNLFNILPDIAGPILKGLRTYPMRLYNIK